MQILKRFFSLGHFIKHKPLCFWIVLEHGPCFCIFIIIQNCPLFTLNVVWVQAQMLKHGLGFGHDSILDQTHSICYMRWGFYFELSHANHILNSTYPKSIKEIFVDKKVGTIQHYNIFVRSVSTFAQNQMYLHKKLCKTY